MNIQNLIIKLSQGNPGALVTLLKIYKEAPKLDPDIEHGLMYLLIIDSYKLYGADIYVLYNDHCKEDIRNLLILLRATQLGFFKISELIKLTKNDTRDNILNSKILNILDKKVCNELPNFKRKE